MAIINEALEFVARDNESSSRPGAQHAGGPHSSRGDPATYRVWTPAYDPCNFFDCQMAFGPAGELRPNIVQLDFDAG
jgi:hypothetical protein